MKKLLIVLMMSIGSLALAQNDTWTAKQDFGGGGRFLGTSFSIGSKVYAGTGLGTTFEPQDDFWEYDVTNNSWSPKGDFDGGARGGTTGFSINGKGYVLFGTNITSMFKDVWEYDPANDTWLKKADFPGVARAGAFVFVINNKAYLGAGQDEDSNALSDLWEYDPAGDSWVQKTALPSTPRLYAAAFALGSKGYVGSGLDEEDNALGDFWQYDPSNNSWTQKANLPIVTSGAIAFATATRGYMGLGNVNRLYSYYPIENVWAEEAAHPLGFGYVNASVAFTGGKAYVGLGGVTGADDYYAYTPGTDQAITFDALTAKTFGDGIFSLSATSSSGLTVSFTSSNTSVATISGSNVTIVGAGTSNITANQAGNGTFDAALPVQRTLTVNKANQSLTFNALGGKNTNDAAFDLTATASSTLPVSYVSSNTNVATINGVTVTIVGAGSTTITASQAGNANYNAAASVDRDLVVTKVNQTITFGALTPKTVTSPSFELTATASSGLPVSYQSSNTAVATILGSRVTIVGGGTTTITASQAGDATYNAAASVDRDLVVTKSSQTWIGSLPSQIPYGTDFTLSLHLSSGLPYTLTSSNTSVATVSLVNSNWVVKPTGKGTTTLTASHAGNAAFEPAPTLTQDVEIPKADQTLTFTTVSSSAGAGYVIVTATSSSGLPVTFDEPEDLDMITVRTGNIITIFGAFGGDVVARQDGNEFYNEVETTYTVVIGKKNAPLTMDPIPEKAVGDPSFVPTVVSVSPAVPYTFSSTNPSVAQIIGGKVTIIGKGTTNIFAVNPGDFAYNPSSTFRELVVKENHVISFAAIPEKTIGDAPFTVTASSNAPVSIVFTSSDPGIATVEGNTVTIKGVGSAWITATAGDAVFARKSVSQVLTVKNTTQTFTQQGQLFGVSPLAGTQRAGVLYKTNADGSGMSIVKEFKGGGDDGTHPGSSVTVGTNGKLYGWTGDGGSDNEGTFFEFDPATNALTKKYDFTLADYALKNFIVTPAGKIYGSKTRMLNNVYGSIIFEFDVTTGAFTKEKGVWEVITWVSDVFMSSTGKIYVTGSGGSQLEKRVVAEYDPVANTLTKKVEAPWYTPGTYPTAPVEANGKFYGTTQEGGANQEGFIYEFDPVANTLTQKLDMPKSNFNRTSAQGLMKASNGKLYGVTSWGGNNQVGFVYEYNPVLNTMTNLAYFPALMGVPNGQLTEAPNGKLYGTDNSGNMGGSLFEFNPATNELRPMVIFNDFTGKASYGNLGLLNGKLYAYCSRGGANNGGTIVEFNYTTRTIAKKYDFGTSTEGYSPMIGLAQTSNGKLYGINKYGGAHDNGTIFEYDPATDVTKKVFDFDETTVGSNPQSPLLAGINGKLYGSTWVGTTSNNSSGTLFEFDPNTGGYKMLVGFYYDRGVTVKHQLAQAKSGKLYGITQFGGTYSNGVFFEVDPETKVYRKITDFDDPVGKQPVTAVTVASNGKIYGTTPTGGANNVGVLFEYDPVTNVYAVKHHFAVASGSKPYSVLIEIDGKLWGTASAGGEGATAKGVIFHYDPATAVYTKKYELDNVGGGPGGKLLNAANGKLYVVTTSGGVGTGMPLVEYDIASNTATRKSEVPASTMFGEINTNFLVQTVKSYKVEQTITVSPIGAKVFGQAAFTPTATATSGLAVVFTAGNSNITVGTDGAVTMVKAGKGILKANQSGDAKFNMAPEVETTFCINPPKPSVTFAANSTGTLTLTSSGESGNQWYKDGTAISGAVNKAFEATTPGLYTVKTIAEDCASEASTAFPIVVTGDTEQSLSSVVVYPNPTSDKLFITLPGSDRKKIMLLHTDGRTAEEHDTAATLMEVDVRSYSPGLYFVRVSNDKGNHTIKFIKK